jgi:hypothetical protein
LARGEPEPGFETREVSVAINRIQIFSIRSDPVFRQMTSYNTPAMTGTAEDQFGEDNGGVERSMVN